MKLPKKIKRKWLRALRSGTYKQAKGTLYRPESAGFCCLGVLQHCVSGGSVEVEEGSDDDFRESPSFEWYKQQGIEVGASGRTVDDAHETALMKMNDGGFDWQGKKIGPKRFKRIADWIEKNIETTD